MDRPIVVVGGGIVGTAIAYRLQVAETETILVERDIEPQGASAFSFASLSAFDEPQHDVYLLKIRGLEIWRGWAAEFGDALGARFPGELRWAESRESGSQLRTLLGRAVARGYSARFASAADIEAHEPAARPRNVDVATLAPEDGQVEARPAIEVLRDRFAQAGGVIVVGRASLLVGDRGITVRVADDRIEASTVIIAAGGETSSLLDRMGWDIPMDPSPGLLVVTEPLPRFLTGTVYVYPAEAVSVHLRQLPDGRVLIGERAQDEIAKNPTLEHARLLLRQARASFPALGDAVLDHFTVEWRPMPSDQMPIVGPLPGLSSLYVATGHSGITIAPALAEFITQELAEGTEAPRLRPLRPGRFSAHQADAHRSVAEAFGGAEIFLG
jgi:glycine/D-amino acid oxidase-like deaminating enzyme